MSEQTPWAFRVKVNVNRSRPSSGARPPQQCSWPHYQGLHLGKWRPGPLLWKQSLGGRSGGDSSMACILPLLLLHLLLQSLVVHQRLDFVHQLTCNLQDMLHIMTLSHFCGLDTVLGTHQHTTLMFMVTLKHTLNTRHTYITSMTRYYTRHKNHILLLPGLTNVISYC